MIWKRLVSSNWDHSRIYYALNLGKENVDGVSVDKFKGKTKLLAFWVQLAVMIGLHHNHLVLT